VLAFVLAYDYLSITGNELGETTMITRSKQNWNVGQTVKVGFLSLVVTGIELTPGDYMPDAYLLMGTAKNGAVREYRFVPHNGLERIN
jgi:hypothetical protein